LAHISKQYPEFKNLMKKVIQLIGVIFLFMGGYFVVKAAYHLLYEITFGLNPRTFGYDQLKVEN